MLGRIFSRVNGLISIETRRQNFHVSSISRDLSEFFDDPKNFKEKSVRVGRQWHKNELRIKSNEDLHKLWFVLLKERNMLLTMEQAYKDNLEPMPNPERLDKVEESMENLECIVRERNRAFHELETGESGERERIIRPGPFGLDVSYVKEEHFLPRKYNSAYRKMLRYRYFASWNNKEVKDFHGRFLEMRRKEETMDRLRQMRMVAWILKRFPDSDEEAIREKYPLADINAVKRWKKVKGHHQKNDAFNVE